MLRAVGPVALAVLAVLVLLPGPAAVRAGELAAAGRLARPALRSGLMAGRRPPASAAVTMAGAAGGLTVAAFATLRAGPAAGIAAVAAASTATFLAGETVRRRASEARRRDLTSAVEVLVGELRAGATPHSALAAAAEAGPRVSGAFAAAAEAAGIGRPVADVLAVDGDRALRAVGLAWQLGSETGAALAAVLTRVVTDLEAGREQRRAAAVALSGPRASAVVLAGLPVLGIGLGVSMGAQPGRFLLDQPSGRAVGCVGVLLDLAGVLWMRRIVRRAERA